MTIPDAQFAAMCREQRLPGFLNLRKLLPSDTAAAKALRAETAFVSTSEYRALHAPQTEDFALQVRTYLIAHELEWNFENLLAASKHVLSAEKEA